MTLHQERTHPVPQRDCWACKVGTLNFGIVPGAFRDSTSTTMFDREDLLKQFGDKDGNSVFDRERVEDTKSDFLHKQKEFLSYDA